MGTPLEELAIGYLLGALESWASRNPGRLQEMARSGADLVPELRRLALSNLHRLAPFWQSVLRSHLLRYDERREEMVARLLTRLQQTPGEVGQVARAYPQWASDHLRRLFNLAVLWARGEGPPGAPGGSPA